MPRTDLLDLISVQDKVANKAKDISGLMLGRQMTIPAVLAEVMLSLCTRRHRHLRPGPESHQRTG